MPALTHLSNDHDETLIARLAAGDLTETEAGQARALAESCPACAQLETDLRSIMAATAGLPAPSRTRDFRLTDADAARLRRTGWRRLLGRFGDPRLAFTRPLATGLVALGIAGLVFAGAPAFLQAGGASTAAPAQAPVAGAFGALPAASGSDSSSNSVEFGPGAAGGVTGGEPAASGPVPLPPNLPSPAASTADVFSSAEPASSTLPADASSSTSPPSRVGIGNIASGSASAAPAPVLDQNPVVGKSTAGPPESTGGPSALVLTSVLLLLAGAALFVLRWAARRAT
jgi:hypothetical protein